MVFSTLETAINSISFGIHTCEFGFACKQHVELTCDQLRQCVDRILGGRLSDEEARDFFESYADTKGRDTVELDRVIHNVTVGRPLLLADFAPIRDAANLGREKQARTADSFKSKYGLSTPSSQAGSPRGQIDNSEIGYHRSPTQMLRFGHVHDLPDSPKS